MTVPVLVKYTVDTVIGVGALIGLVWLEASNIEITDGLRYMLGMAVGLAVRGIANGALTKRS